MTEKNKKLIKKENYSAKVKCTNCGNGNIKVTQDGEYFSEDFVVDIPKGSLIKDVRCPNCDCKKLVLVKD